jgi:mannitol 2-dehydrogenase
MTSLTQQNLPTIASRVPVPEYDRSVVHAGIVHFGVGAFHRSHQAMFIDRLLQAGTGKDWGICGVGVLPSDSVMRDVMAAQDNLYTLVLKHPDGSLEPRIIGSIVDYLFAPDDPAAVIAKLADPATRIVSLTVTEGGYSVNDATGEFDASAASIQADLVDGAVPATVFGLITEALRIRRAAGTAPFTVMSCDNIQGNGHVARVALTSFASLKDAELGEWIASNVSFPNSMVDRITPATTDQDRADVQANFDVTDEWPVVSESFEQWVLEDDFTLGRPPYETVGVQIVEDVEPYELMKLRLLNAAHQAMSYLGVLAGFTYVHDVCQDPDFSAFLLGYMTDEATPTLKPVPGIDLDAYRKQLLTRFSSAAVRDTLARQVVDGSDRIPKFLLPVIAAQLQSGGQISHSALVLAGWARFLEGLTDTGAPIEITDKRLTELQDAVVRDAVEPGAFLQLASVFGDLGQNERLVSEYVTARARLGADGAAVAVARIAG